jgi:hypothetical protein
MSPAADTGDPCAGPKSGSEHPEQGPGWGGGWRLWRVAWRGVTQKNLLQMKILKGIMKRDKGHGDGRTNRNSRKYNKVLGRKDRDSVPLVFWGQ